MKVWVFLDGIQQGPFDDTELTSLPGFGENTKVWFEGLPRWQTAGSLDELRYIFEPEQAPTPEQEIDILVQETSEPDGCVFEMPEKPEPFRQTPPENPPFFNNISFGVATPTENTYVPCPPTYVGLAIFLFICCCSPVSLAALASSICVSVFHNKGEHDKANKASEITAWLIMIAIALGMLPVMLMSALWG